MAGTSGSVSVGTPDAEFNILCDDDGAGVVTPFLRRYTAASDGTVATEDLELDGTTPYTPAGTVTVCAPEAAANPEVGSTAQRQTGAGTVTVPAGARSVTLLVLAGTASVAIGGGAAAVFPAGASATWSVDRGGQAGEQLGDEFVFTGVAGSDFAVLTTREA